MYDLKDKDEIMFLAETCKGKSFGDLDKLNILDELGNKGALGHVVEMNVFEYNRNSNSEKDFLVAGLELKVTPYRVNKNGTYSAKERLVLSMIDYYKDYDKAFSDSSFWHKNNELLLMFYKYDEYLSRRKYLITHILDFTYPKKDLIIIMNDYETIQSKIRNGQAHLISESDTMYLAACTKGALATDVRKQPFSNINAKQRAYSLKTTYMTQVIRELISKSKNESIFIDETFSEAFNFEQKIRAKVHRFFGMSQDELINKFKFESKAKNINELLLSKMLGIKGKVSKTDEFLKANIIPKTIRVKYNGSIKESMSFPPFKFTDIYNFTWEDSSVKEYFETSKFLFIIFKFNHDDELIFEDIKLWNLPSEIIDTYIMDVYNQLREVLISGNIITKIGKDGMLFSNFPGMKFNGICHIRPHAQNRNDEYILPVRDLLTGKEFFPKQCFWLNNKYIETLIG